MALPCHYKNLHTLLPQRTLHLPLPYQVLNKTPMVFLWIWVNLLPFAINNQRKPEAIQEDSLNKPWRTMPSQTLSPESAKHLMLFFYFIAILISGFFGNVLQCLVPVLLGHWYNDLRGADANYLIRNFINSCGFICLPLRRPARRDWWACDLKEGRSESAFQLSWMVVRCDCSHRLQHRPDAGHVRSREAAPLETVRRYRW